MARRTKLTRELMEKAADLVERGHYVETVCRRVGIHPSTFYRWMEEGRAAESGVKREFCDAMERASASVEVRAVDAWQRGFDKDWRAAQAFLERRFPARWGNRGGPEGAAADEMKPPSRRGDVPAFATEEEELEWWAKERGRRLQPAKFVVAHLPWPGMPKDGTEVQWDYDSRGRKLWPLAVTLNHFTPEEREVYETTGLAPWEIVG